MKKTGESFSLTNVLPHLFPDQSIQPHSGPSLSLCRVCNMSQQSTQGRVTLTPGTHIHTDTPYTRLLLRSCRIDKITPPWSSSDTTWVPSLFLGCSPQRSVPPQLGRVTANQAFLSQRCGARGCKAIAPPHPRSGHGEAESDGGCHLTASNST